MHLPRLQALIEAISVADAPGAAELFKSLTEILTDAKSELESKQVNRAAIASAEISQPRFLVQ
jgi:hypothetical protein